MAEAAVEVDAAVKPKRVKSDLPPGLNWRDKDMGLIFVRIKGRNAEGKPKQIDRPIPGLYKSEAQALEAQAAAQEKYDLGEAVWPKPPQSDRNPRGQVCAPAHCAAAPCAPAPIRLVVRFLWQGKKLPPSWTYGAKKWNHGAPLSKKATGVGRGKKRSADDSEIVEEQPEAAEPPIVFNVLLPADRNAVNGACLHAFLAGPAAGAAPAMAETGDAIQHLPRARGWLQREIDAGQCEAPVPQAPPVAAPDEG